jgi:RHS repeat-associated protein
MVTSCVMSGSLLFAGASPDQQAYVVTLRPDASIDGIRVVARQMAASYGGTVVDGAGSGEDTFVIRLPQSRARVLATDPHVKSIAPMRLRPEPQAVVETVNWSGGVSYSYDGSGNISQIGSDAFVYDSVSRLVKATVNGVNRTYQYDAYGNRTACNQLGTNDCQGFSIDATENKNRIAGAGYDAGGNVTNLSGHIYSYDALNMMTRDSFGALAREFVYTADDERIATYTVGSSWNWTVRGVDGKVLREFASNDGPSGPGTTSWRWTKDNVWRNGLFLASRQPDGTSTTTYHYHLDHLGTPRRVTDQNDRIVGVHDYLAYGPEVSGATSEPSATSLKFTGHERDNWSSTDTLDYMHARYYSASLGRFLSFDPVIKPGAMGSPQLWNRYSYTANNPMNRVDPDGRNWFSIDGTWEWHKGAKYTRDGNTYSSNYTHLLVAQSTGTKNGTTTFKFTLYNQNKVAMTGTGFSGGVGPRIAAGNYKIRTDVRDATGPNAVNPNSPDNNPPQFYGIQVIRPDALPNSADGQSYDIRSAYGPMRARLNPMDGQRDAGAYFHGQEPTAPNAGQTHGCLCYGQNPSIINYLWKLNPQQVPVAIDIPVTPP